MATAITALATTTLSGASASITFGSIPSTYRDFIVVVSGFLASGSSTDLKIQLNSDTASNYYYVGMSGNGGSATSFFGGTQTSFLVNSNVQLATGGPGMWRIEILDATATDKHKTLLSRADASASTAATDANAGRWASTSAVNTIKVFPAVGSFGANTTLSLYGVAS